MGDGGGGVSCSSLTVAVVEHLDRRGLGVGGTGGGGLTTSIGFTSTCLTTGGLGNCTGGTVLLGVSLVTNTSSSSSVSCAAS